LCTGGEYNGAAIFALEHVQKDRPGLVSGLISSSCVVGALSATMLGGVFLNESLSWFWVQPTWFWRIPFLFGALVSIVGYFLRRYTFETIEFTQHQTHRSQKQPTVYGKYFNQFIAAISVGALNGVLSYTLIGFLNVYMTKFVGFRMLQGLWCNVAGLVAMGLSCVAVGAIADRLGEKRAITYSACLAGLIVFPAFTLLMQAEVTPVLLGQVILGIAVGGFIGTNHFFLQSLFPVDIRYKAVAFGFCLGMAISGGTTAMLLTYLIMHTHNLYTPAFLILTYVILFMGSLSLLPKKSSAAWKEEKLKAA
jgi:MHS family proline/betaine transporter-like MFS transporter